MIFGLIQLVPYGRDHDNPPVVQAPNWDTARTELLTQGACYDCHSNNTKWPWYSNVAPMSWLLQRDVDGGRASLNFSEMNRKQEDLKDVVKSVAEGDMPPLTYTFMHPAARLSEKEKRDLIEGLRATFQDIVKLEPAESEGD